MKRLLIIIGLLIVSCAAIAQENPTPMPPNYERIQKETTRWFGEFRYKRLAKRFERCDTTMTVDHFRCLYYGAWLRRKHNNTDIKVDNYRLQYVLYCDSYGESSPEANHAWWRLQMLLTAIWSSGNGSKEYPFYVTSPQDMFYMIEDLGLHFSGNPMDSCFYQKDMVEIPTDEGVTVYVIIGAPRR